MKKINLETWTRRGHFEFFKRIPYPLYNTCFDLEMTRARDYARELGLSFNATMIHLTLSAVNRIENLRYRLRGNDVVLHDVVHPVFAHLKPGEELFKLVFQAYDADLRSFASKTKHAADTQTEFFPLGALGGRDDLVFVSALPWISFTSVDHTASLRKEDAIPRITWGKYRSVHGQILLPYNIQVNHLFVDGIHVGWFKEALDAEINAL